MKRMNVIARYEFLGRHNCPKSEICIEHYFDALDKEYKFFEIEDSFFTARQVRYCRKCGCDLKNEKESKENEKSRISNRNCIKHIFNRMWK